MSRVTARVVRRRGEQLDIDSVLTTIRDTAHDVGVDAHLVGGFVRDRLLGRGPSKDIDLLTTSGGGERLLDVLSSRLGWARPQVFERFGTAQIRGDGYIIEVVRARAESYDPLSRKPDVRPGTLEEDIWRRDLTVNALCQTLDGAVLDITGRGLDDLRAGVLRTPLPPADTFREDPLRMFRVARFRAQLGFRPADGLVAAVRTQAARLTIVSVERISDELRRLLVAPLPRAGIELLREGGLLALVLPEVDAMVGVEQSGYHVHDVYDHSTHALDTSPPDLVTRTAVLLHDVGKPATHAVAEDGRHTFHRHDQVGAELAERILTRLRFSGEETAAVARLVRLHLRPIHYQGGSWSDRAVRQLIRDAGEHRERMMAVARADTAASAYPDMANLDELTARMEALDREGQISRLTAALDGDEIMAMAGRGPGPWVGRVKRALEEAVIAGELPPGDRAAARRWVEERSELLTDG